jgi:hypothetical protein
MTRHAQISKVLYIIIGLAMCFPAASLFAEDRTPVFKGTVRLPFETRWGTAILPPGEYTLSVHSTSLPARVTVRGKNGSVFITAQSLALRGDSDRSSFLLISKWRRGVVRSLYVSELGMAFNYAAPKEEAKAMTQEALLIERVPVTKALN